MRKTVNAILYQNRSGCQWDLLPHDLPPAGAVKYYFYKWRDNGTDQTIHGLLRWQLREKKQRLAAPSLSRRIEPGGTKAAVCCGRVAESCEKGVE
ncbi:hypothetical protein GCM10009837_87340 [Streptomyces durmitorensis]